ncbi:alpha-amylase family glycosyl hydrolase [Rhodococcus indonesiensis]|uniref:alpha-amylase family glycosyl hydrolase n=1 Tax=Rhodococcus indonesiensis TaxID=3055869 RepID=UPI0039F69D3E
MEVAAGAGVSMAPRGTSAAHPFLYEINTWPWLDRLSGEIGRRLDLGSVPDEQWDAIAALGFDAVWLMGVWERSPAGVAMALADDGLVAGFEAALGDYESSDVVGSPYCIRAYEVDPRLGGRAGLGAARAALGKRGLGLILDFVPNHVAPDHPWTTTHPERFVQGTADDLRGDAASFVEVAGRVLANGRDPYFPAWPDVVQLDAFSPSLRSAVVDTLCRIADQCDGVRCDMAMLMMNDVFARTWGDRVGAAPADDYWAHVIPAVRRTHPTFRFIAEAYWDSEWALHKQGFDFCYDKRLYDRLVQRDAGQVHSHLLANVGYQEKLVRFLENHDEPRAAAVLDPAREKAVAVATLTQTGARLVHDGQIEGRRVRLPVFLGRFPAEPADSDLSAFYHSLLATLQDTTFRTGTWRLCARSGWPGNDSVDNLVAWCWDGDRRWLVVVNLSPGTATGRVGVPWDDLRGVSCRLVDPTNDVVFDRAGADLCDGLYVELGPWHWHLFHIESAQEEQ